MASCQGQEAKYIVRSLEGKLRIGNAERTVLVALAHAAVLAEQEAGENPRIRLSAVHGADCMLVAASRKLNKDKLAARLEDGAEIIKQVYRLDLVVSARLLQAVSLMVPFSASCPTMTSSFQRSSMSVLTSSRRSAS